jgi:hypothetical protein
MHCSRNLVRFRRNLLQSSLPEMKSIFPNRRQISTSLHDVTFNNTVIVTHMKILNLNEEEHKVHEIFYTNKFTNRILYISLKLFILKQFHCS